MHSDIDAELGAPRTGKLTEAELDASISNVIPLHRGFMAWDGTSAIGCPPCNENCNQGDDCPARQLGAAKACNDIGAEPSRLPATPIGVVLILLTGGPLVAALIGLVAYMALMHLAACDQDDAVCMFTWKDSK